MSATVFPASKLGEYLVTEDIAEGTFGIVKKAIHTITGHEVALKYISKAAIHRDKTKPRVRREFEYMRTLRHPHIIKLYEVISTPSDIIFVLEYAKGELFNYIVQTGYMEEDQARRFFQQIISGMEYSHRLKIVHRDLKPENILLDDNLNVKITDFGLSSEISDGSFLTTSCGSPNYAAPEVIRGGQYAGPEIDVWSCGVILYVMLCGRLPFDDADMNTLFHKIGHGHFTIPHHLSADATDLIRRMLVVDPLDRITIPEITQHPFFTKNLARYLSPLPPPPGPVLGTLSSLVTQPQHKLDFEYVEGLGPVEDSLVEELASRLEGITKDDVWDSLRRNDGVQGNSVKVAYQLLKDKKHLGKDLARYADHERDVQEAALDPRNAVSPQARSPGGRDLDDNPFEEAFGAGGPSVEDELGLDSEPDTSDDSDEEYDSEEEEEEPIEPSTSETFAVLNSSLPEKLVASPSSHHLASYATARRSAGQKKQHRSKWHFGIRSRSAPFEIILEVYRVLQDLGMEWKTRPGPKGLRKNASHGGGSIALASEFDGGGRVDLKSLFMIESRARMRDVVVLMDLRLYNIDKVHYLVDFHHKKTYRASTLPGAGKFDMAPAISPTASFSALSDSARAATVTSREDDIVVSPYTFMDVACNIILVLASGNVEP